MLLFCVLYLHFLLLTFTTITSIWNKFITDIVCLIKTTNSRYIIQALQIPQLIFARTSFKDDVLISICALQVIYSLKLCKHVSPKNRNIYILLTYSLLLLTLGRLNQLARLSVRYEEKEVDLFLIQVLRNHLRLYRRALTCDSSCFTGHLVDMDNSYRSKKPPWAL